MTGTRGVTGRRGPQGLLDLSLVALIGMGTGCLTTPSLADGQVTSCGSTGITGQVNPDLRKIDVAGGLVVLSPGRITTITACFYRDLERSNERAAVSWSVSEPGVVSLSPAIGPSTNVTAIAVGQTKIRALITGVTVEISAVVCPTGGCPPSLLPGLRP